MIFRRTFKAVICVGAVVLVSCSDPPLPTLSISDRKLVDSFYTKEYNLLVDSLDLWCEELQTTQLQPTVDSILAQRKLEIQRQKSRYQK